MYTRITHFLFVCFFATRFPVLGRFVTCDELLHYLLPTSLMMSCLASQLKLSYYYYYTRLTAPFPGQPV